MKSSVEIDKSLNQTLTILASACIHAALMVGICCSATVTEEKPVAVATKLIEIKTVPQPLPPPPSPSRKKPDPPKPQEKKPDPPKPPEKKPDPPKPIDIKPSTPAVVKDVKIDTKKLRMDEIRAQMASGEIKRDPNPRPQQNNTPPQRPSKPTPSKSQAEYTSQFMDRVSTPKGINLPASSATTNAEVISDDYAARFVRAILYDNWHPSRTGMKYANPMPVDITFDVTPSGKASNPRITKQSNDAAMNDSVKILISQLSSGQIRFTSFADAGVKLPLLTITVTMYLENK